MTTPVPGMGTVPPPGSTPVLLIALQVLRRETWAGRIADVQIGSAFWARLDQSAWLIADGFAEAAPVDTPEPPFEPDFTANQQAGAAAGTTNASPGWKPTRFATESPPPRVQC